MPNKASFLSLGLLLISPVFASAQNFNYFFNFLSDIGAILAALVTVLIILALVVFFWGLIRFIASAGDEEGRKRGKQVMIWGIIVLAVMVSIWGIINLLQAIFGISDGVAPNPPGLPGVEQADGFCFTIFGNTLCFDF